MYECLIVKENKQIKSSHKHIVFSFSSRYVVQSCSVLILALLYEFVCVFIGLLRLKGSAIALEDYNRLYQQDKEFKRAVCP